MRAKRTTCARQNTLDWIGYYAPAALSDVCCVKVTVFVHVVFLKVGEIDTVKETYTADVFVQARWREPLFDGQTNLV